MWNLFLSQLVLSLGRSIEEEKNKLVLTCDTDSSSTFLWNLFLSQLVLTCAALHTEVTPHVATCVYFMVTVRLAAGSEGVLELLTWRSST